MGVTYPGAQVTGNEYMSGRLVICTEGALHVSGPMTVSGAAHFSGPVALTGTVDLAGAESVTGIAALIPVVTSDYAANPGEFVPVDATTGSMKVTLPDAPGNDTAVTVKMIATAGVNTVTVETSGTDVFDVAGGTTTRTLTLLNQGIVLQYGSAAGVWYVEADDLPLVALDARYLSSAGGDLSGTLNVLGGGVFVNTPGIGFGAAEGDGSDAKQGVATLVGGTATVTNSAVTSSSRIFLTIQDPLSGTPGAVYVSARTAGVSFVITSTEVADVSIVAYEIFEPG